MINLADWFRDLANDQVNGSNGRILSDTYANDNLFKGKSLDENRIPSKNEWFYLYNKQRINAVVDEIVQLGSFKEHAHFLTIDKVLDKRNYSRTRGILLIPNINKAYQKKPKKSKPKLLEEVVRHNN